jgi:hypothetical protein
MSAEEARGVLAKAGLYPVRRGETLSIEEFVGLARAWLALGRPGGGA